MYPLKGTTTGGITGLAPLAPGLRRAGQWPPAMDQIVVRPARTEDTPGMARLVDTHRAAHRGQVPDGVLDAVPLDHARAGSRPPHGPPAERRS